MFISRWIIAVALGLVLSTSLKAQDEAQSVEDEASGQQQPTQVLPILIPVQIIEDDERASSRERREAESEQREKDALIAQQGMNTATQAMNEATQSMKKAAWWSLGTVIIGTLMLGATLFFNSAAVSVTRRIGQAQTRSYLYLDSINAKVVGEAITGMVYIANSGTSPALRVKKDIRFYCSKKGFEEQRIASTTLHNSGDVHSQEKLNLGFTADYEEGVTKEIEQGHINFWIFGCVEYVDVFEQKWRLDFRRQYHVDPQNGPNGFIKCAEGNSLNKIDK
jgi:hypothetical protein